MKVTSAVLMVILAGSGCSPSGGQTLEAKVRSCFLAGMEPISDDDFPRMVAETWKYCRSVYETPKTAQAPPSPPRAAAPAAAGPEAGPEAATGKTAPGSAAGKP